MQHHAKNGKKKNFGVSFEREREERRIPIGNIFLLKLKSAALVY